MQDVRSCIAISELVEIFSARLHRYLAMGYFHRHQNQFRVALKC